VGGIRVDQSVELHHIARGIDDVDGCERSGIGPRLGGHTHPVADLQRVPNAGVQGDRPIDVQLHVTLAEAERRGHREAIGHQAVIERLSQKVLGEIDAGLGQALAHGNRSGAIERVFADRGGQVAMRKQPKWKQPQRRHESSAGDTESGPAPTAPPPPAGPPRPPGPPPPYAAASTKNDFSIPSLGSKAKPAANAPSMAPMVLANVNQPVVRAWLPSSRPMASPSQVNSTPESSD